MRGYALIVTALASNSPLDALHHDHALGGPWTAFRDCHVKPNLVLIYEKPDADTQRLVSIGSHAELGL